MNPLTEYKDPVGAFAFHRTPRENIHSIQAKGIQRVKEPCSNTATIETVLSNLGYDSPFPFDRTNVTYCHVDAEYVAETLPSQTDSDLSSNDVTIVVDITEITAPMYLADMRHASDLIDYLHGGADVMLHADTPEQAVEQYRDSITPVDTPTDIAATVETGTGHAELIVDGNIPPEAIVDIVE